MLFSFQVFLKITLGINVYLFLLKGIIIICKTLLAMVLKVPLLKEN